MDTPLRCPLLGKNCITSQCMFWTHVLGSNPQTNAVVDEFNCAISLMPILMINNANETRKTAASVQSFRNEMVCGNKAFIEFLREKDGEHPKITQSAPA